MLKVQTTVRLVGVKADGTKARIGSEVAYFTNAETNVKIGLKQNSITMVTHKDTYKFLPHTSIDNLWTCTANGVICHFSKKKLVATLIYWS